MTADSLVKRFEGLTAAAPGSFEFVRRQLAKAEHWQAKRARGSRDSIVALDMFSGCGGSSQGIEAAGIDVWYAANHWEYAVQIHERNHPGAEHFIADLVDTEATDYFHPESLPRADVVWASPSCTNHSKANAVRAYQRNLSLFDSLDGDTDYDDQVTASERSRATAVSVLQYARKHLPKIVVVENVVEFCFPAGTVVLTKRGLVAIEAVKVGDQVMTHQARWKPVTAKMSRIADTVRVKGYGNSIIECTPNHPFYAREEHRDGIGREGSDYEGRLLDPTWVPADDLVGTHWATPRLFPPRRVGHLEPQTGIDSHMPEFWRMVGLWLGDGWLNTSGPKARVRICANSAEANLVEKQLSEVGGLTWNRQRNHGANVEVFEAPAPRLAAWLRSNFGEYAHGKTLPSWVFSLTHLERLQLLGGYVQADGHERRTGVVATSTVSRRLAVGIKMLVESLGRPASIMVLPARVGAPVDDSSRQAFMASRRAYIVTWRPSPSEGTVKFTETEMHRWGRVREVEPSESNVQVYDLTVADDHSFIADGQVVHNCQWGNQTGTSKKGDGTTFQWWLKEFAKLGYLNEVLYLNSQFFPPCPQSRDRMYVCLWQKGLRKPDIAHRPEAKCSRCDDVVQAEQRFKPRTQAWPTARWGKYGDQYIYACPTCGTRVYPVAWPAMTAIDWSDLGTRIGDRERPLAGKTMERIQRGVDKFGQWPPFLMPAKAVHGTERSVDQPFVTQTTQQELMMVSSFQVVAAGNTFERPGSTCRTRGMDEPLPTQHTTPSHGMVTAPPSFVVANRTNATPRGLAEALPTITTAESRHLLVSDPRLPFIVKNNGGADPKYRSAPITEPLGTFSSTSVTQSLVIPPGFIDDYQGPATGLDTPLTTQVGSETHGLVTAPYLFTDRGTGTDDRPRDARLDHISEPMSTVSAGGNHHFLLSPVFAKQNGGPADTAWHQVTDRLNTLLSRDTTCLLMPPSGEMPPIDIDDCFYRMLAPLEIQLGMGLPLDFAMWGSARVRVKALGNAVTPPVAQWVMERMAAILK